MRYRTIILESAAVSMPEQRGRDGLKILQRGAAEKGIRLWTCDVQQVDNFLQREGQCGEAILFVGTNREDMKLGAALGLKTGLAVWACESVQHVRADYYFNTPYDIWNMLSQTVDTGKREKWMEWAMEMQFLAQAGITYTKDRFDLERFERLRELSAEIMSEYTETDLQKIKEVFCNETGFQTPKMDTRAAVIEHGKILLVREFTGKWALPGGWVDVNQSVRENTIKETKEEAGLDVIATRVIALHDRNRHNRPVYAYGICKVFVLCETIGGAFEANSETTESAWFAPDELPELAEEKVTAEQIHMCFAAYEDDGWEVVFD